MVSERETPTKSSTNSVELLLLKTVLMLMKMTIFRIFFNPFFIVNKACDKIICKSTSATAKIGFTDKKNILLYVGLQKTCIFGMRQLFKSKIF